MKIILIKTSARTQRPQPPTLSEAGEPASASGHQTRRQLGDSRAVKTTPVNASLAPSHRTMERIKYIFEPSLA